MHYPKHDLGPLFWHKIRLQKKSPLIHRFPSHEVEEPFRVSNSIVLRLPWASRGIVVGWWRHSGHSEQEMLVAAMQGRVMAAEEFDEAEKQQIRRNMIKKQFTADEQALLVEVLDL